jgi:hypothetical protein
MIKVQIEIVPGGFTPLKRAIATMTIGNVSDLADISDYEVVAMQAANPLTGAKPSICGYRIAGHDRRQSIWDLLAAAIAGLEGAECSEL